MTVKSEEGKVEHNKDKRIKEFVCQPFHALCLRSRNQSRPKPGKHRGLWHEKSDKKLGLRTRNGRESKKRKSGSKMMHVTWEGECGCNLTRATWRKGAEVN